MAPSARHLIVTEAKAGDLPDQAHSSVFITAKEFAQHKTGLGPTGLILAYWHPRGQLSDPVPQIGDKLTITIETQQ